MPQILNTVKQEKYMVTLTEIAKRAGVNPSTVSKALRGSDDINKETASQIISLAAELGYTKTRRNHIKEPCIGILCPEIISSYYARIVSTITELFQAKNIETFITISEFSGEREESLLRQFIDLEMAAIICITEQGILSPLIRECISLYNIPILQIGLNQPAYGHDNICVDERIGVNMAINHLIQLGHKEIAFFGDEFSGRRKECFQEALQENGLYSKNVFITELRHWQAGYDLAQQLLSDKKKQSITAIVAEYDDIAVGSMRRFTELGLKIPDDYSLIGFDDAKYCRYLPISLTTIESHVEEMCGIAFNTLYRKIQEPNYKVIQNISISPDLISRESTAVPAARG
jgi:DNA-binding LacI/PurR family transcriptional regulator